MRRPGEYSKAVAYLETKVPQQIFVVKQLKTYNYATQIFFTKINAFEQPATPGNVLLKTLKQQYSVLPATSIVLIVLVAFC